MLGTKNSRYGGIFKASKENLLDHTFQRQRFVATILVIYVTILTEPDLSQQN